MYSWKLVKLCNSKAVYFSELKNLQVSLGQVQDLSLYLGLWYSIPGLNFDEQKVFEMQIWDCDWNEFLVSFVPLHLLFTDDQVLTEFPLESFTDSI